MEQKKLTVGVIGTGRIGRLHAENLGCRLPRAKLAAVCDSDPASLERCAAACNAPAFFRDYRELLRSGGIQAIAICSSTDTHASIIEEAARAGKHIFCEKPIDTDLQRTSGALAAVKRAGVFLQIGFNRRFDANYRRVKEAIDGGEIGKPQMIRITSRDPAPPPIEYVRRSGGIFLDMTIHDFDMARFLIGGEVEEVFAAGGVLVDPAIGAAGDLDTAVITLRFLNGVLGTIDNSRQAVYGYDQRVEVFGSAGCIATDNNFQNSATLMGKASIRRDPPLNFFLQRYLESYLEEMRQFIDAVLDGKPSPVPGEDSLESIALGLAAGQSIRENRPIRLDSIRT